MSNLYDKDFPAWAEETAQLLTERRFEEIDLEALVDEVQDLSRREKETVKSFLETIIEHLLKVAHAPAPILDNNLNGWTSTVRRTRRKLGEKLADSRVLLNYAAEKFDDAYAGALYDTMGSTADFGPVDWPEACPWSIDQVLDPDFIPSRKQR
ncbi:MAG: DUF29 domain-containing protein [Candidatus Tectomicrobia bacterium]|nr:DUF29 domain-containing protein [Candidatus Tectomicrobia bacterium]